MKQIKKWVTFGDSVTWYNQQPYLPITKEPEKICNGYQVHLEENLPIKIENQGISGDTVQDVCQRSSVFDYQAFEGVSFFVGINNFNQQIPEGQILDKHSVFDQTTFCGAYQGLIEDVLHRFPEKKILLIAPYKVWKKSLGLLPEKYSQIIKEIGHVYQLPVCDLYHASAINPLENVADFVDNPENVDYYFHVNDQGYEKISQILIPFFQTHLQE